MKTRDVAVLAVSVLVFAAVAAVALPFDPVHETADADPDDGIAPASDLPEETEDDGTEAAILGIGLVSVVLVLILVRFWTMKVE